MQLSITSLRLLSFSLPLFYLTAPLMWELIAQQLERALLVVYALAAVLNGFLNYYLIPHYGAPGSAVATGLTELFILLGLLILRSRNSLPSSPTFHK